MFPSNYQQVKPTQQQQQQVRNECAVDRRVLWPFDERLSVGKEKTKEKSNDVCTYAYICRSVKGEEKVSPQQENERDQIWT
jgi:hypothetical protein